MAKKVRFVAGNSDKTFKTVNVVQSSDPTFEYIEQVFTDIRTVPSYQDSEGSVAGLKTVYVPGYVSPNNTAPVLTLPTGVASGSTTATVGATTDEAGGTFYTIVSTNSSTPSAAQIIAGLNAAGAAATYASSKVPTAGINTFSATGLTASTTYYAFFVQTDSGAANSNIVGASSFTTDAAMSAEAAAFLARTSGLDAKHTDAYVTMIDGLVTDGVWAKLDALYVYATKDQTTALLNLVSSSYNCTANGSPQFVAEQGFMGVDNSSTVYISTGFNPTTASSPKFTQNSGHISAWNLTDVASGNYIMGAENTTGNNNNTILVRHTDNNAYFRLNNSSWVSGVANSTNSAAGHYISNRSASNAQQGYKNGSSFYTAANVSTTSYNGNIYTLAGNIIGTADGTYDECAAASIGSSLNSTEAGNLYTRLKTFKDAVAVNTLVVDGNASNVFTSTNTGAVTLTTTRADDVIVLQVYNQNNNSAPARTVSTVTSANLTWTLRKRYNAYFPGHNMEIWWAHASAALTNEVVTVTLSGSTDSAALMAFGVSGSATPSSPWDSNASLATAHNSGSGVGVTVTVSGVSTTDTNPMVFGFTGLSDNVGLNVPTGTARIRPQTRNNNGTRWAISENFHLSYSSAVSSASYSITAGATTSFAIMIDALAGP